MLNEDYEKFGEDMRRLMGAIGELQKRMAGIEEAMRPWFEQQQAMVEMMRPWFEQQQAMAEAIRRLLGPFKEQKGDDKEK